MARSIFEEVSEDADKVKAAAPAPGAAEAERRRNRRAVSLWLFILAAMVVIQILVGGWTRLTDSGLSMVEWRPQGFMPPVSETDWLSEFEKYQTTTEFKEQNADMTLDEFKGIYWWEWGHRTMGRAIGLAFLAPFAWFLIKGMIPSGWTGRIVAVGALGALQGVIGWWMVASGLVGRVDVSQYRLAVHLGVAFLILGLLLWYALSLRREEWDLLQARRRREKGLFAFGGVLAALVFLQIVIGAFVAGLKAWGYSDWPTMGGGLYPPGEPFTPFETAPATQFLHRMAAYLLIIVALVFWWRARGSAFGKTRLWANIFLGTLLAQVVVGVAALVHGVPAWLGSLHQFTAIVVFAVLIHAKHQLAFPKEERIGA